MCLPIFKKLFSKKKKLVFMDSDVALPSIPKVNSLQDVRSLLSILQKQTPNDIEAVLESELMILDVVKSPSLIEGHFDSLVHQFENAMRETKQSEAVKERFVCMVADMFFRLDVQYQIDMLEFDEQLFNQRKELILMANNNLSNNVTRVISLASDTIKRTLLASIETAKAAGKTAMVVVDEFGHDIVLVFDGGLTNLAMKDISYSVETSGNMTFSTTTDDTAKQQMSANAKWRAEMLNENRGTITYNAEAYINEWAKEMQNIVLDATIFDTQNIAQMRFEQKEERGKLLSGLLDQYKTKSKQNDIYDAFNKTLFRLIYKLEKHSIDIGRSNYVSDIIDRYIEILPQADMKEFAGYVSNMYNEHPRENIVRPQDYDNFVQKILGPSSLLNAGVNLLGFIFPAARIPIIGFNMVKSIVK